MKFTGLKINKLVFLTFAICSILCPHAPAQEQLITRIVLAPGSEDHPESPVMLDLSGLSYHPNETEFSMFELQENGKEHVPCQFETGVRDRIWFIPEGNTRAGMRRHFALYSIQAESGESGKTEKMDYTFGSEKLVLESEGKPLLEYRYGLFPAPQGIDPLFSRSCFIHPLYSPAGHILTRIQPSDHYHHYGIWNPWTNAVFEGRHVDFWNLGKGEGTVRFGGFIKRVRGPVYTGFSVRHEHVDFTSGKAKIALNETWDVRVWDAEIHGKETYMWDMNCILSCAEDEPVLFEQYRYGGGIGFRATRQWGRDNSTVLTSEGFARDEADATSARWCIVQGEMSDGTRAGILFMSHPSNRDHPEPMRVWPSGSHDGEGNVFFEFTPIREKPWRILPGKAYVLKYRMVVFDHGMDKGMAEKLWNDFAFPMQVIKDN